MLTHEFCKAARRQWLNAFHKRVGNTTLFSYASPHSKAWFPPYTITPEGYGLGFEELVPMSEKG